MRIELRLSEVGIHPLDKLVADRVLHHFSVGVDLVPSESERLHQEQFDEAVAPSIEPITWMGPC